MEGTAPSLGQMTAEPLRHFPSSLFSPEEHGIWIQIDLRVDPYTVALKLCVLGQVI